MSSHMAHMAVGQLIGAKRYDEAIRRAQEALASNPLNASMMRLLALAQLCGGHLEDVLETTERAIATNFSDAHLHKLRGSALSELGRYKEAYDSLETALELDPSNAFIKCTYVNAIARNRQRGPTLRGRARELARLALADEPAEACVHVAGAQVHILHEEWREAEQACRRALKIDANDADALRLLARAQKQQGLLREAGDSAVAAGRADPRAADTDLLLSLGKAAAPVGLGVMFLVSRMAKVSGRGMQAAGGSEAAIIVVMLVIGLLAFAGMATREKEQGSRPSQPDYSHLSEDAQKVIRQAKKWN